MIERTPGRFLVALTASQRVRVMAAVMHGPADELRERHQLRPTSAVLAAEGLVAAVLLSAHLKGDERMTVDVHAEQPEFVFLADINADGTLRARFSPTHVGPHLRFSGPLMAMKSLGPRELYRGVSEVRNETFSGALQRFLTTSQQVDARVRVRARVNEAGEVVFAAGLLVERLPGMDPEEFAGLFDEPLRTDFEALMTNFAFGKLAGETVEVLGSQDFVYRCSCSLERVVAVLRSMGPDELASLRAEQGRAEVTCHYCNSRYEVDGDGLDRLIAELQGS